MELEFVAELPTAKRGRGNSSKYDPIVAVLRENPGEWAVVLRDESRSKVGGAQRFLKTHYEGIEASTRADGNEVVLFARAVAAE